MAGHASNGPSKEWTFVNAPKFVTPLLLNGLCRVPCAFPLRDDPDYADAIRIETALGIPVLRHDEKKPGGIAEVLAFFEGKDPEGGTVSPAAVVLCHWCFVSAHGFERHLVSVELWNETVLCVRPMAGGCLPLFSTLEGVPLKAAFLSSPKPRPSSGEE